MRFEPAAPQSRVKHYTTEPLPSSAWYKINVYSRHKLLELKPEVVVTQKQYVTLHSLKIIPQKKLGISTTNNIGDAQDMIFLELRPGQVYFYKSK